MCSSGSFQNSVKKSYCLIFCKIVDQMQSVLDGTVMLTFSKQVELFVLSSSDLGDTQVTVRVGVPLSQ